MIIPVVRCDVEDHLSQERSDIFPVSGKSPGDLQGRLIRTTGNAMVRPDQSAQCVKVQALVSDPVKSLDSETCLTPCSGKEAGLRNVQSSFPSHERVGVLRFSGKGWVAFCGKFDEKMSISGGDVRDSRHHVARGRIESDKNFGSRSSRRSSEKEELRKNIRRASSKDTERFLCQFFKIDFLANMGNRLVFGTVDESPHSTISDERQSVKGANGFSRDSKLFEMTVHQEKSPSVGERVEEQARQTQEEPPIPILDMTGQREAQWRERNPFCQKIGSILKEDLPFFGGQDPDKKFLLWSKPEKNIQSLDGITHDAPPFVLMPSPASSPVYA